MQPAAGDCGSSTKVVLPENRKCSRPPETAVPVLKSYYQKRKIQPAAGGGGSSTKVVLPENENAAAAGDGGSSTKVVLPENENPAGRRRRRFQY